MLEKVKEAFDRFTFLTPNDLIQLALIVKVCSVKKDAHLVKVGDLNYNVMVVINGLVRHYVIDEQGNEKTLLFVSNKNPTTSMDTIFHNKPAVENIMALENSLLIKFDFRAFEKLASGNIRLLKILNTVLKETITSDVEYIRFLNLLTPEERYIYFRKKYPDIVQRVKQKHLASYLGITTTSLSRLRARVI